MHDHEHKHGEHCGHDHGQDKTKEEAKPEVQLDEAALQEQFQKLVAQIREHKAKRRKGIYTPHVGKRQITRTKTRVEKRTGKPFDSLTDDERNKALGFMPIRPRKKEQAA